MLLAIFLVFCVRGHPGINGLGLVNLTLGFPPVLQRKQVPSHVFWVFGDSLYDLRKNYCFALIKRLKVLWVRCGFTSLSENWHSVPCFHPWGLALDSGCHRSLCLSLHGQPPFYCCLNRFWDLRGRLCAPAHFITCSLKQWTPVFLNSPADTCPSQPRSASGSS